MSHAPPRGDLLPELVTAVPGPRSRDLGRRLGRVESRNVTRVADEGPIFWAEAAGANVVDVDGNRFIDLTAGFGVAAAGHANDQVAAAVARQVRRLPHAMGDVHPAAVKVELLERLAELAPGDLEVSILSANGSDAVESALKTAVLATGRPGVVAFRGGYHGLGYGALGVTGLERFRAPFGAQLYEGVRFARFPESGEGQPAEPGAESEGALEEVEELIERAGRSDHPIGAVLIEPIQGRSGIRVPPPGFLRGLRELCTARGVLLILDEVYSGLGRTGDWFACEAEGVVPDILVIGKSLAGGLPLSAAIGSRAVMDAWPASEGEALHTSTFLGNPVTCSAALAQLGEIERLDLVGRARTLGALLSERLERLVSTTRLARAWRGRGLMQALELGGEQAGATAAMLSVELLRCGVIVLAEGPALAFSPPLVLTEAQLEHALDRVEERLGEAEG